MNDRDQRRYDRLTRVQTFGRENSVDFAAASKAKTHFGNVDTSRVERAPVLEKKATTGGINPTPTP